MRTAFANTAKALLTTITRTTGLQIYSDRRPENEADTMQHSIRPTKTLLMLYGLVAIMLLILAGIAFGLTELIRPGLGGLERGGPLDNSYHEQEPLQWTPDGRTIIAGISGTIYKIGVDRVELTPIHKYNSTEGAHSPSLSPEGDRIVYSRKVTDEGAPGWPNRMLFISNLDGSNETLVSEELPEGRSPVWSPDGKTIAFKNGAALATITPDGANLTYIPYDEIRMASGTIPVWSPDSKYLAFTGSPIDRDPKRRTINVYAVAKDGTGLTMLGESAYTAPGWTPDSENVIYGEVNHGSNNLDNLVTIHQISRDGSEKGILFRSTRSDHFIPLGATTWLPNSNKILFSGKSIATLDLESRTLSTYEAKISVPADRLNFTRTATSADGTKLATLVATNIGPRHLLTMNPNGTNKRSLAEWNPRTLEVHATNEVWVPDAPFYWVWTPITANPCPHHTKCNERNVSGNQIESVRPTGAAFDYERETFTVEELLELGLQAGGASPTHIAVRATTNPDSVRCQHRPVARTITQREQAIRYWLNLDDDEEIPTPDEIQQTVAAHTGTAVRAFQPVLKASFTPLTQAGVNDDYQFLTCYADHDVTEYILGAGPDRITVAYDRRTAEPTMSYDLYKEAHDNDYFGNQPLMTTNQHKAETDRKMLEAKRSLDSILDSRNAVIFLSPMAAHHTIAVQAWQVIAQWEIQTDDEATLLAVRHGVPSAHEEYSQTLANLTSRITAAATTDAFADDRIADVSGLTQHYRAIGAYDDITPGDGSDATFMPAMPPPVPTCAGSTAAGTNPGQGLITDCNTLLGVKDTLAGTGTLNWSKDLAMASWDGIRLGGTPQRVQFILLTDEDLDGSIPAYLGELSELRRIDLDENSLTGGIPPQLGNLKKLTHLHIFDNQLTGQIPPELASMAALRVLYTSDNLLTGEVPEELGNLRNLTQLVLADNQLSGPLPDSLGQLANLGHLRLRDNQLSGQIPRSLSALNIEYLGLSGNIFTGCLPTGLDTGGNNDDLWRSELQALPSCGPSFGEETYSFPVAQGATDGDAVGTVTATPYETGDTLSYAITAGNGEELFEVGAGTGTITLARAPTGTDQGSHTLTVQATDGYGQEKSATVTVEITG